MTAPATWGPFVADLDAVERKAQLRSLRVLVRAIAGPRGEEAAYRLLLADITPGDGELLAAAAREFDRLPTLDRRRILSSFAACLPAASRSPALAGAGLGASALPGPGD